MEFKPYMTVQIIFFIFTIIFFIRENRIINKSPFFKAKKKHFYLLYFILFLGILIRSIYLTYPQGVNVDEAMGGYDAWSLANYGVDGNLSSYPVYLRSWNEGQSALYAYLSIPFIKLFGLSPETFRLAMSLVGCFTVLFFYWILRKTQKNALLIFCLSAFWAINPWHILKCRFGLDCNIFPDIFFIGVCFLIVVYYRQNNSSMKYYLSAGLFFIALSAYGYAVSWIMTPLFVGCIFYILIKKRITTLKQLLIASIPAMIIVIPLLLFCVLLVTGGGPYQIWKITITTLARTRLQDSTIVSDGNVIYAIKETISNGIKVLVLGVDTSPLNTFYPYGYFYNFLSIPFLILAIVKLKKKMNFICLIFIIWIICSLPIMLIVSPSIYHWNTLWIPLSAIASYGIYWFASRRQLEQQILLGLYSFSFIFFVYFYFDKRSYNPFDDYLYNDEIKYANNLKNVDKIYYPDYIIYSYILFYTQPNPYMYNKTRKIKHDENGILYEFSYGRFKSGIPSLIEPTSKTAYIVPNIYLSKFKIDEFKIQKGNEYSVIWNE